MLMTVQNITIPIHETRETLNQMILGTCRISFGVYKVEFGRQGLDRLADSRSSVRQTLIKNNEGLNKVLKEAGLNIISISYT